MDRLPEAQSTNDGAVQLDRSRPYFLESMTSGRVNFRSDSRLSSDRYVMGIDIDIDVISTLLGHRWTLSVHLWIK